MKTSSIIAMCLFAIGAAACDAPPASDKAAADGSAKPADKKAGGEDKGAEEADKPKTETLEKLGLTADLPEFSTVSDAIGGGEGVMIIGAAPLNITVAKDDDSKTVDAVKKDAEMFTPENFKDEKWDDGWLVTFENKGSMGVNYWMEARREIDGKAYKCSTSVMKDDQRKAAIDICKSLKKK